MERQKEELASRERYRTGQRDGQEYGVCVQMPAGSDLSINMIGLF
jgi:hypothetical protein